MVRFISTIVGVALGVITGDYLIKNGRKIINFIKGGKFEVEFKGRVIPPEEVEKGEEK